VDLWYPKAIRLDGPAEKQGYAGITTRQGKGLIGHSAEGRFNAALAVLNSTRQVSFCLFIDYYGGTYQFYPLSAVTWHGGCVFANAHFVGVEHEGRAGEPLTRAQVASLAEFTAWLAEQEDWPSIERRATLREHREMAEYGAAPTACPSGRIPWQEVIEMATLIEELDARLKAVEGHLPLVDGVLAVHGEKLEAVDQHNAFADAVIVNHEGRIKKLEK